MSNSLTQNVSGKNTASSPNASQQALATKSTGATTAFRTFAVKTTTTATATKTRMVPHKSHRSGQQSSKRKHGTKATSLGMHCYGHECWWLPSNISKRNERTGARKVVFRTWRGNCASIRVQNRAHYLPQQCTQGEKADLLQSSAANQTKKTASYNTGCEEPLEEIRFFACYSMLLYLKTPLLLRLTSMTFTLQHHWTRWRKTWNMLVLRLIQQSEVHYHTKYPRLNHESAQTIWKRACEGCWLSYDIRAAALWCQSSTNRN